MRFVSHATSLALHVLEIAAINAVLAMRHRIEFKKRTSVFVKIIILMMAPI
jgi:hypothetical protein